MPLFKIDPNYDITALVVQVGENEVEVSEMIFDAGYDSIIFEHVDEVVLNGSPELSQKRPGQRKPSYGFPASSRGQPSWSRSNGSAWQAIPMIAHQAQNAIVT